MSWEKFLCFNRTLFRFHFRVGVCLVHHDFGGEFLDFNFYWCRCKFAKERTSEHVYFPDNPRIHWERQFQFQLPWYLSFFRVLSVHFEIKEKRIGFCGQTIWNWNSLNFRFALWTVKLSIYCDNCICPIADTHKKLISLYHFLCMWP